ncbi:MAG: IS3 family transposase [Acidimicrobiales bacterium]
MLTEHGCKIAPNTYWAARKRPPSKRAVRDEEPKLAICRVHADNLDLYGADKVWTQLNWEGTKVARCTLERLMRDLGLSGVRRGKAFKVTTRSDERQHRPNDLVDRDFTASTPNRLWVADLTYVKTHSGWLYAAFIIEVSSPMVVGWQLSNSLQSDLAIDALRWRSGTAPGPAMSSTAWCLTPTRASSTSASATASASPRTTSSPRSDPPLTARTTRWPRRSTASTSGS